MKVQHISTGDKGKFFVEDAGKEVAEMVYSMKGSNKMVIEHTQVDEQLRGKNIGVEMIHASVDHARLHQMKIIPVCKFAKAVIDKKPDFQDVLDK